MVRRAKAGDEGAAAMLFERFHDEIYRFATRRLGDPVAGQEAAADTLGDAFASLHRYRATGPPFEAWLYTIARRRVADMHRLRQRSMSLPLEQAEVSPDHAAVVLEEIRMRALIEALPPVERDVIELRFMEGLDVASTAARLGKRPGAIRVAQHRALARLREVVEMDR